MEARHLRAALVAATLPLLMAAGHRTPNFIIATADPQFAQQLGQAAEKYRRELAVAWLGEEMPNWSAPCPMTVHVGPHLGAGGATTFMFDRGEVFGWRMSIQGSRQRLLDSVLPHEITHMIFASRFRQPVPRWADEGGATSVEHPSERQKHHKMLYRFLTSGRGIAFSRMFAMRDYPRDVMPLYAQGYSVAEFLIQRGGRRKFVEFLDEGIKTNQWSAAIERHYGIGDLGKLQHTWLAWVRQGCPPVQSPESHPAAVQSGQMLASAPATGAASDASPRTEPAPSPQPQQLAAAGPIELPSDGWRAAGQRRSAAVPAPRSPVNSVVRPEPLHSHVTRPQPFQHSRQIILEWSSRFRPFSVPARTW